MGWVTSTASYAIDAERTIRWTDNGFGALARDHGCPELADGIAGQPLGGFVAGDRPRDLLASIIERASTARAPLELRYRCDGPEARRFAVLRVAAQPDGGTVFTTWFEAVEQRPHQPLLDYSLPRGDGVVRLCAWCNRVDAGGWREIEDVTRQSVPDDLPRVEHSVCEICELLLTTRPAG